MNQPVNLKSLPVTEGEAVGCLLAGRVAGGHVGYGDRLAHRGEEVLESDPLATVTF